ncbi:MAG: fumarylacetoacetate hydrolase family protein [Chloroflexota bacterium]
MKIIRYSSGGKPEYGILDGNAVRGIAGTPFSRLRATERRYNLADVRLLAPCTPSKIVALGLNYRAHAAEVKMSAPAEPLIFLKPPTAVIGPEDNIVYPESSRRVDFEGELGVVIKTVTRKVSREDALSYILGYTCFNDVTARDLQYRDKQWTRAKGFDTFAAIGPYIETDLDPDNVLLETRLNGELKQHSSTSDLIFPVAELVSFASHVMTLLPGDVIATGTPSGIAPMKPGDTVEVKIEKIGTLRNHVVQ